MPDDVELVDEGNLDSGRVEEISLAELNQLAGGPATGEVIQTTIDELRKRTLHIRVPREQFPDGEIPRMSEVFVKPPEKKWQQLGKMPYAQEVAKFKVALQGRWQFAFRYWIVCVCGKKVVIIPGPFSPIAEILIKCVIIRPNLKPLIECFTDGGDDCCNKEKEAAIQLTG